MKTPKGALILVADGTKARLLTNTGTALDPQLATLLYREEVNPPSRDQGTAAPGRTQSSTGVRRSSYDETDWHDQAEEGFARNLRLKDMQYLFEIDREHEAARSRGKSKEEEMEEELDAVMED